MIGPLTVLRLVFVACAACCIIGVFCYNLPLEIGFYLLAAGCFFLLIDLGIRISQELIGIFGIIAYVAIIITLFAIILLHDPDKTAELFSSI